MSIARLLDGRGARLLVLLAGVSVAWGCGGGGAASTSGASTGAGAGAGTGGSTGGTSGGTTGGTTGGTSGGTSGAATTGFQGFQSVVASSAALSSAQQQAQLSAFVASQKDTLEGFPLRSGRDVIFVYQGSSGGPLAVAGEFNGWSTSALPLSRIGSTDVWSAQVTLPAANRYEYKIVASGSSWMPDGLNRKFTFNNGNSVLNLAGSGKSHLERVSGFHATLLNNDRDLTMYLPAGALDSGARYPVLYMHDGQNLFDPSAMWGGWGVDATLDAEISGHSVKPIIVVGVDNTMGRFDEYTPVTDDLSNSCNGSQVAGGKARDYADFLVNDVKPFIDGLYPTLPGRENTAVLGSSLGGLVSIYLGFANTGTFRMVGGMSSTLDWGQMCQNNPTVIDTARLAGPLDILVYIDSGGSGTPPNVTGDNYASTVQLRDLLASQGYQFGVNLMHWFEPNATHDEAHWRVRLFHPLEFWFHP